MKIIKISMELGIEDTDVEVNGRKISLENIAQYLNDKLYADPEFFGDFGQENIETITEDDGTPIYDRKYGYSSWVKNND